ncbi:MAG: glycosyltransferase family 2 protein [Clostridia bacterium]|nr:glycosyltransferase family 2 protein [Clostridia bacterium]
MQQTAESASEQKLLTVVVPCYNSAAYMEEAVNSLLVGGGDMDVLLVDDGSKDDTGAIADRLAKEYPGVVRVIHQPNGGHGSGLNRGIETAKGIYFKVVDSDDRLDPEGLKALLDLLRAHAAPESRADLVVHDYVYDHGEEREVFSIDYAGPFPQGKLFTWNDCRRFSLSNQFIIHCLVYRTGLLREHHYTLPEHTFYEDNLYVYQPLPWVKKLLYLHKPVYGYNVGRADQSVNETNLLKRLDQLTNMITAMATSWHMADLNRMPKRLRQYMVNNVSGQIWSLCALHHIARSEEGEKLNRDMWRTIREWDAEFYQAIIRHPIGHMAHWRTALGKRLLVGAYRLGHKLMKFG